MILTIDIQLYAYDLDGDLLSQRKQIQRGIQEKHLNVYFSLFEMVSSNEVERMNEKKSMPEE